MDFEFAVVFQGLGCNGLQKHASFQKGPCALRQNVPQNNNRFLSLQPQTPTGNIERVSYKNYFWGEGFCGGAVILEGRRLDVGFLGLILPMRCVCGGFFGGVARFGRVFAVFWLQFHAIKVLSFRCITAVLE